MRRSTLRTAVAVVTAGLTLTACGSDDGGTGGGGSGSGADAATATSAEDFGGMDALIEAAQEEGTLNVIALPPDWANYGEMLDTFSEKYDIEIDSASPDGSSQDELNAVDQPARARTAPPTSSTSAPPSPGRRRRRTCSRRTRWRPGTRSPRTRRTPTGHWYNDYGGYISIGCNATVIAECPTSFADLLDPQYAGQVALNGNPTQAAAAFSGVWAAVAGQRRQPRRHRPGHRLLRAAEGRRQLQPGRDHPGHDPERRDPDHHRLGLPQRRLHRDLRRRGRRLAGQRPERRALRRLLQPGDQQVRPAPGGGPALAGVPLQRRGPEHLAEGRRPAGPAARDGGGRHRRRRRLAGAAARSRARPSSRRRSRRPRPRQVVAERWNAEISG